MINVSPISTKLQDDILASLVSDYVWYKLRDGSDSTVAVTTNTSVTDATLTGAVGTFWTGVAPLAEFNSALPHTIKQTNNAIYQFCQLSTLQGHFLIYFDLDYKVSADANVYLTAYTMDADANGGWAIKMTAANYLSLEMRNDAAQNNVCGSSTTSLIAGGRARVFMELNTVANSASCYINGVLADALSFPAGFVDNYPSLVQSDGFVIGGHSPNQNLNIDTNEMDIGELFMMRVEGDISSQIPTIGAEFGLARHELPWSLEGL